METSEILYQSDAERLSYLNFILSKLYNFEAKGMVYSEDEQENLSSSYE